MYFEYMLVFLSGWKAKRKRQYFQLLGNNFIMILQNLPCEDLSFKSLNKKGRT
jgi:hypothetical protein